MEHKDKGSTIDREQVKERSKDVEKEKQELLKKAKKTATDNARLKVLQLRTLRNIPMAESNDRMDRVLYLNRITGKSLERELNKMTEEDIDEWARTNESGMLASKADKTDGRIIGKIEEAVRPDYGHWKRQAYWTLREACYLLINIDPDQAGKLNNPVQVLLHLLVKPNPADGEINGYEIKLFLRQHRGYQNITKKWLNLKKNEYSKLLQTAKRGHEAGDERFKVSPSDFLSWASENEYDVPEPFEIILIKKPPTGKQKKPSSIDGHLREIGKKGGEQPKYNKPILEAVIQFLQSNPQIAKHSNENILKSFGRKVKEDTCIKVKIDGYGWEVYCYETKVYSRWDENLAVKNPNKPERSIAYSTFKKTYIPMAKKHLEVQEN